MRARRRGSHPRRRQRRSRRSRGPRAERCRLELRKPHPGAAATSTAFGACRLFENTRIASTIAIAITAAFSRLSGAPPASSRPSVIAEPAISTIVATWPTRSPGYAQASASNGSVSAASHRRAPRIAQPSARAQPIGTRISAIQVSASAVHGTSAIAPTTTAIDSGSTNAHAPVRRRRSQNGSPAAGSRTHAAWAVVSTMLSAENHMPAGSWQALADEISPAASVSRRSPRNANLPISIQRTYLLLMFGNTLAASFIWGINTIFLLDAGLSNLEAFAANAFFTAGMVLFEVPTGIVADTVGRRASYLLGTVTLAASTLLYVLLWQVEAPFWQWAVASILLGLGFTFFSGAVEAWLVDALTATGSRAEMESVFGRGQVVSGARCSPARSPAASSPSRRASACPSCCAAGILVVMFVVAFRLMHDVGFTPEKGGRPLAEMRKIASASIEYGWRVPAVKWLMVEALFTGGVGIYALLRPAALPARALRRPRGVPDRRPGRRRSSPAPRSSAAWPRRGSGGCSTAAPRR